MGGFVDDVVGDVVGGGGGGVGGRGGGPRSIWVSSAETIWVSGYLVASSFLVPGLDDPVDCWGTSNEEGRRLYELYELYELAAKKNVISNVARIACLWCPAGVGQRVIQWPWFWKMRDFEGGTSFLESSEIIN